MIQRIQTLYLLLACVLSACTLFMPLAYFSTTSGELYDLCALGLRTADGFQIQNTIYLLVLVIASIVLPLGAILSFKNQMLQMRLCVMGVIISVGVYAMTAAYFYLSMRLFGEEVIDVKGFHPALFAPLAAIVASVLAARGAFQDMILLRSVDRIR
ncbi:MAG: DUF4293 domain-containing protein [Rikenellaceae bacterium]